MKNIVLCSDGTGNSGGYGSDSNVYKTYKAVDNNMSGSVEQYTFYDQGVGTSKSETSKNKYTTALSGAFGFGFRNNVLHLYHALARSYDPGDTIFLFGFSRGAATIRALIGFINACGLVDRNKAITKDKDNEFDEEIFKERVEKAFELYRKHKTNSDERTGFKKDYAVNGDHYAPDGNLKIKFVGVWDTVSALGFPKDFSVLFQGFFWALNHISDKIPFLAHNFYDYELNNSIENAYHALSIDDERTTFHPLVWDERKFTGHVEQVWFAGVHSNVGGGYPRTGLSDVTLNWMLTKAEKPGGKKNSGLVFYKDRMTEIEESANAYDKLYDSRDGVGVYYRYGPRDLVDLCKKDKSENDNILSKIYENIKGLIDDLRITEESDNRESRLKGNIAIHVSAYSKMKELSDAYAPDGIPTKFDVIDIIKPNLLLPVTQTVDVIKEQNKPENEGKLNWNKLKPEMEKVIKTRKIHYRIFVELTMAIIIVSGLFWFNPPKSIIELNACEKKHIQVVQTQPQTNEIKSFITNSFFAYEQDVGSKLKSDNSPDFCKNANKPLFKDVADIARYVAPDYFKNFITYVMEVHSWIVMVMLLILLYLYSSRKCHANKLDKICRQMAHFFPELTEQSETKTTK